MMMPLGALCLALGPGAHAATVYIAFSDDTYADGSAPRFTYFHGGRFKQLSQFGRAVIKELIA